tara:strand:+ start:64 stop:360 length:297 start_codon:yes stop_codon:yes gene_type:complete
MVRKKKIEVPTRAEGDPTGQTQMLQEQIDAVSPGQEIAQPTPQVATPQPVQDVFATPTQKPQEAGNVTGEETMFTAQNDIEIVKQILLEKFPTLTSRF